MTDATPTEDKDKRGDALYEQRFQMLADIAKELSGDVIFPTYFDAILRLRTALDNPNLSMDGICKAIALEPLISAKLTHLANSVAFNPGGEPVVDLKHAIARLGLSTVRTTALAIALRQLMRSKSLAQFAAQMQSLWEHSIRSSAAARVLASRRTRLNPEEAMLAGLIHDLGAFYMLYRGSQYEELRHRPDSLRHLIIRWHESIGHSLLDALGLPSEIVEAIGDHDRPRPLPVELHTLSDVIYVANLLGGCRQEWCDEADEASLEAQQEAEAYFGELLPEIALVTDEFHRELKGE